MSTDNPSPAAFGLSVVIPCLDEAPNIDTVYRAVVAELGRYDLEVLFVDDGSTDDTLTVIRRLAAADPRVEYLSFARNFGFEAAFSAGYRYASRPWVLHVDADLQFPPAEAHKLVALADPAHDAVFGIRAVRRDSWPRRVGATVSHLVAHRLLGIEIPRGVTTFRLVRTSLARQVVDLGLGTPYFLATLLRMTSHYATVATVHQPRVAGASKFTLPGLARHAIELFVGFSNRIATAVAMAAMVTAAITALSAALALLGVIGVLGALAITLGAVTVALLGIAAAIRYLVLVNSGQPRVGLFYVRESSLAVRAADHLYGSASSGDARHEGGQ